MTPDIVVVTGACGNLGRKVIETLAATPWCERILGIDRNEDDAGFSAAARDRLTLVAGDLTRPEPGWRQAVAEAGAGAGTVIHLAALNPAPDAGWDQSIASLGMTANLLQAAGALGVGRFVFASSNHVMGGYKDAPLAASMGPGRLTTALTPAPGTRWDNGHGMVDSTAYATSKAMGERLCQAMAETPGAGLTSICLRIGWAQPGENDPRTVTYSGTHWGHAAGDAVSEDDRRALRWYRGMWLSNGDLSALFIAAVTADAAGWPGRHIIVNGVSRNRETDWDLASAAALIGYRPQDDLYDHISADAAGGV